MASKPRLRLAPESVSARELVELRRELLNLQRAVAETEPNGVDDDNARRQLSLLSRMIRQYGREVQLALHGLRLGGSAKFEDHDQFASLLLFLRQRFQRLKTPSGSTSPQHFFKMALEYWHDANPHAAGAYAPTFDAARSSDEARPKPKLGIVTVLEHEYQSVLRRLDEVHACSDDSACGFAILERLNSSDDLKAVSKQAGSIRGMGWADGSLDGNRIIIVCTGDSGVDNTRDSIKRILNILPGSVIPEIGWLVVGVCGGTAKRWPIGTVLISSEVVVGVKRKHSTRYEEGHLVRTTPMAVPSTDEVFTIKVLYRRAPVGLIEGVAVADPRVVPVHRVKFACTPHVVNDPEDQEELRRFLAQQDVLNDGEDFGIEMEGVGAEFSSGQRMAIIKSVCDYADSAKGGGWSEEVKQLFQLYAAETASEVAMKLSRMMMK